MNYNMVILVYREKVIPLLSKVNLTEYPSMILCGKLTQLPYYDSPSNY